LIEELAEELPYLIISTEIQGIDKDVALQMAFKAVNDTAGPDGSVPTLLVYGALPQIVEYDAPSPTVAQRSTTLKKAMTEIRSYGPNDKLLAP
jgi:hypothetical protein